jgi:alkanesulfonate monooxygenase SsuD/methylene tetrahydromethanopterin reductase-like flavin-dependent oxidoreductase (luciferase family)
MVWADLGEPRDDLVGDGGERRQLVGGRNVTEVAADGRRIGLAATGLDVSRREPTGLARAAASLDLLSGGRLNLALAGEHVDEVTEIVRGVLDAGEPGPLRHLGQHYRVPKAERGPLPAHRIPIWLTGDEPDRLRLAGRTPG